MLSFLDFMTERNRKAITYRLDELVTDSMKEQALEEGVSVNRWLENHLFDYFKNVGKISKTETRLPENRGGDRKSKNYQKD
jgi:hypothetical protein